MEKEETRKGYTFQGWYIDPEFTKRLNPGGILPHELTLYDKWTLNTYTISYDLKGGKNSKKNPTSVTVEDEPIKLYPAHRDDKIFVGWTLNGIPITYVPSGVYMDITLVANYKSFSKVRFETRGGGLIDTVTLDHSKRLKPFRPPMKMGYEFDGWYYDVNYMRPFSFEHKIEQSCILYAKWKVREYEIQYHTHGGHSARTNPKSYNYFSDTIELKPAFKKGYKFIGWFDPHGNKQERIFRNSIGNKEFFAKYKKEG